MSASDEPSVDQRGDDAPPVRPSADRAPDEPPLLRIREPGDLLETVPYLLGFHPRESLVLVGLRESRVVVTARIDLPEALGEPDLVPHTVMALRRGGALRLVAAVYDDSHDPNGAPALPWRELVAEVDACVDDVGAELADALLVARGRWWSYLCQEPGCCPPEGRALPGDTSIAAATATYAGLVALPGRSDVEALLTPRDDAARAALEPLLAEHDHAATQAVYDGRQQRMRRAATRALFAAARNADRTLFTGELLSDDEVCRFGVALGETPVRDALWCAIDGRRIDGRGLWRELAARLPGPYDAAPLLLFGWAEWRDGNGALARIAAERALASAPSYTAAQLLIELIVRGVNPHRLPRLRLLPESA